jgi:nitroreductase
LQLFIGHRFLCVTFVSKSDFISIGLVRVVTGANGIKNRMPETTPIHPLLDERWSPRGFADRPVDPAVLRSLFEAARWSASCFNEQPWRFVVATRDNPEQFERVLATLVPKNQEWAKGAWLLGISAGKKTFTHNGAPDRFGLHDAGAALANLMIQARASDLYVHAMGGFDADRARTEFGIPDDFEVGAAFAVGYLGEGQTPGDRSRRPLNEILFGTTWGQPFFGA